MLLESAAAGGARPKQKYQAYRQLFQQLVYPKLSLTIMLFTYA
jgi:hypothetical protein